MPLLRLSQHIEQEDKYRIEMAFEDDDGTRQTSEVRFEFRMIPEDQADIRWYLEDYLQYPMDPAPKIAERVEVELRNWEQNYSKRFFNRMMIHATSGQRCARNWMILESKS